MDNTGKIALRKVSWLQLVVLLPLLLFVFYIAALQEGHIYVLGAIVGIAFAVVFMQDVRIRFASTLAIIVLLQINQLNIIVSLAASFIFTGGFLLELVKKKLLQRQPLTGSKFFTWFAIFLAWGAGIGLLGVFRGVVEFEQWFRELLRWSPVFLLPIYYSEIVDKYPRAEEFLVKCFIAIWLVIFFAAIYKLRENLAEAIYVFQIGIERLDPVNGAFMMFVFVSLAMSTEGRRRWLLLAGFFVSEMSLLLTFARTSWLAAVIMLPLLILFGSSAERRRGFKFGLWVLVISILFLIWGYLTIPTVRLGILFISSKVVSATKLKTDLSIVGRYIEWDRIFQAILQAPFTGHGLGAKFTNYNWFGGVVFQTAYTHSGYLGILFKTGLIGFIMLLTACAGYFFQGIKYMRDPLLNDRERAFMRAGIVLMIFMVILGYTGNIFIQREMSVYIALFWCYCIQIERKLARSKAG